MQSGQQLKLYRLDFSNYIDAVQLFVREQLIENWKGILCFITFTCLNELFLLLATSISWNSNSEVTNTTSKRSKIWKRQKKMLQEQLRVLGYTKRPCWPQTSMQAEDFHQSRKISINHRLWFIRPRNILEVISSEHEINIKNIWHLILYVESDAPLW